MRKIYYLISVMAVVLGLVSCNKQEPESTGRKISIVANTESGLDTKTSLSGNDASGYQVLWSKDDEITAVDADERMFQLTLSEGAGKTSGVFTSSENIPDGQYKLFYGTDGSLLPRIQQYIGDGVISNAPMFTSVSVIGGDVPATQFKNLCGLLRLSLKGTDTIKKIRISSDEDMSGMIYIRDDGTISFVKNYYQDVSLDFGEGVELSAEGTDFYIALPPAEYHGVRIEFVPAEGETITKTLKAGKTLNIARALITPVSISLMPPAPKPDVLCGVFSVSSSKKVRFSKGNLQATKNNGSGYSWGFANEQYQYVGDKAGNTTIKSQAAGSVVDLFSWSTTAYNYGITTDSTYGSYPGTYREWGTVFDNKGTWFTLSIDEWRYLLGDDDTRINKLGSATVCGVKGFVILPDTFTDPMKNNGNGAFVPRSENQNWEANIYTHGDNWDAMDSAGAVFLPAAGWRFQNILYTPAVTEVGKAGEICNYWSSTLFSDRSAYALEYGGRDGIEMNRSHYKEYGYSVRLVTVVNQ